MKKTRPLFVLLLSCLMITGCSEPGPKGDKGDQGDPGLSAYEIFCKYHPDWSGTEEDWINSYDENKENDTYNVVFLNYDNSVLYSTTVKYGSKAVYVGATPTKPEDAEYKYTFTGWDKSLNFIHSDSVFFAQYESKKINYYTIVWQNWDSSVLKVESNVKEGTIPVYKGSTPTKNGEAYYDYEFTGWNKKIVPVDSDAIYVAVFKETFNPSKVFDFTPEIVGGTDLEKVAIYTALARSPVTDSAINPISPYMKPSFSIDNNRWVLLRKFENVVLNNVDYVVNFEWSYDKSSAYIEREYISDSLINLHFNYPEYPNPSVDFGWKLKKATCNKAYTSGEYLLSYTVSLSQMAKYDSMKISDINKVTETPLTVGNYHYPSTFNIVDYSTKTPYFKTNNPGADKEYLYVKVKGKLIYTSPDGNFGLLADGDNVLLLYAGSSFNLKSSIFPAIENEYVEVYGNMAQYQGQFQLAFISKIIECEKTDITEPTLNFGTINEDFIKSLHTTYGGLDCQNNAIEGLYSSLKQVTGTYVENSLMSSSGSAMSPQSISGRSRFSFELKVGEEKIQISYDYHADDSEGDLRNALKDALSQKNAITIKGTMQFENENNSFVLDGSHAHWKLVPFLANHVNY